MDDERNLTNAYDIIPVINKAQNEFEEDKSVITKFKCLINMGRFLTVNFF